MKRKTTKEILAESFRELASSKPIDRITIKDITDNCGYSTATFYRQFRDKYDLIAWEHTLRIAQIMEKVTADRHAWVETLLAAAKRFEAEKDYLANLFLHTSGQDSFIHYMTEINYHALKTYIMESSGLQVLDEATEMYIRIYCLGTVNLTCEWILGKYRTSAEELAEIYFNAVPAPLSPYLNQT